MINKLRMPLSQFALLCRSSKQMWCYGPFKGLWRLYSTSQAVLTVMPSVSLLACFLRLDNGIATVILVRDRSNVEWWCSPSSIWLLVVEKGCVSSLSSVFDLSILVAHDGAWVRFSEVALAGWSAGWSAGWEPKNFRRTVIHTGRKVGRQALMQLESGLISSAKREHIPETMAKSASTVAQIAWLTQFQLTSASVPWVTTETSRTMDAIQTL